MFYEVYVATKKRVHSFSYDGIDYQCIRYHGAGGIVESENGVRVTSLERTVIDSIADFEKTGGLEELLRCLFLVPALSADKLLEALALYGYGKLYQKAGYLLENFQKELGLPESFFEECEKHISGSKTYLFPKRDDFILHRRWKLFAPVNLRTLIDKGVNDYDAV